MAKDAATRRPQLDLLRTPGLGNILRWRWGRLVFQGPLLVLALLMVYDGLTGPRLAAENLATVLAWVHYRGLVILALLLVGNLFCMSCPFTLPRTVARRLSGRGRRWPRALAGKWLAIALLLFFFWLYEAADLWARPWLTAWVIVAYFAAAFVLEAAFAESPFCKYLCPLGSFNFVAATVSPFQIQARETSVCRTCVGKECVNGSPIVLGCGTELFVPQVRSNLDCVFCLDCARACPHDNVALAARPPLAELVAETWPRRWDISLLALVFAFASLGNAFGMVPPVYALELALARWLPFAGEGLILLLIFVTINLVLPVVLGVMAAVLSRRLAGSQTSLREAFARFTPAVAPLAFAIWFAHYGFHFATGALTAIPAFENFLATSGLAIHPHWTLSALAPTAWLLPLQILAVLAGLLASLYVAGERVRLDTTAARPLWAALPWVLLLAAIAVAAILIFTQPMEMRGTAGFSS